MTSLSHDHSSCGSLLSSARHNVTDTSYTALAPNQQLIIIISAKLAQAKSIHPPKRVERHTPPLSFDIYLVFILPFKSYYIIVQHSALRTLESSRPSSSKDANQTINRPSDLVNFYRFSSSLISHDIPQSVIITLNFVRNFTHMLQQLF